MFSRTSLPDAQVTCRKSSGSHDFAIPRSRSSVEAVECKWSARSFESRSLTKFRNHYANDRNFIVAADVVKPYSRSVGGLKVQFEPLGRLRQVLRSA